jgi:hypothetical protein
LLILNPLFIYLFFSTQFTQLLFRFMWIIFCLQVLQSAKEQLKWSLLK